MHIGFDFDNTLISYDKIFYHVALKKKLIPADMPIKKIAVRNYIIEHKKEELWTHLQGEVYGKDIVNAEPFEWMINALQDLSNRNINISIVSHKTKTPYIGEPWDLHAAAKKWLQRHNLYNTNNAIFSKNQVFFELTKEAKVKRISQQNCTHYIDDLPEILEMLPNNIEKILFMPEKNKKENISTNYRIMNSWQELAKILEL